MYVLSAKASFAFQHPKYSQQVRQKALKTIANAAKCETVQNQQNTQENKKTVEKTTKAKKTILRGLGEGPRFLNGTRLVCFSLSVRFFGFLDDFLGLWAFSGNRS